MAPYKRAFEHFGHMSRCVVAEVRERFRTDSKGAFCVKYSCSDDGKEITYHFSNQSTVTCKTPKEKKALPAPMNGTVECPNPEIYCILFLNKAILLNINFSLQGLRGSCLNDCSQNGYCNKKVF